MPAGLGCPLAQAYFTPTWADEQRESEKGSPVLVYHWPWRALDKMLYALWASGLPRLANWAHKWLCYLRSPRGSVGPPPPATEHPQASVPVKGPAQQSRILGRRDARETLREPGSRHPYFQSSGEPELSCKHLHINPLLMPADLTKSTAKVSSNPEVIQEPRLGLESLLAPSSNSSSSNESNPIFLNLFLGHPKISSSVGQPFT